MKHFNKEPESKPWFDSSNPDSQQIDSYIINRFESLLMPEDIDMLSASIHMRNIVARNMKEYRRTELAARKAKPVKQRRRIVLRKKEDDQQRKAA